MPAGLPHDNEYASIGTRVTELERRVTLLEARSKSPATGPMAHGDDLDGPHGNPIVRKNPPKWIGRDYSGKKFSECEPDFLDQLAGFFDWQAKKDDEQNRTWKNAQGEARPKSSFKRKDAMRARGWAHRIRNGWLSAGGVPLRDAHAQPPFVSQGAPAQTVQAEAGNPFAVDDDDEMPF